MNRQMTTMKPETKKLRQIDQSESVKGVTDTRKIADRLSEKLGYKLYGVKPRNHVRCTFDFDLFLGSFFFFLGP